MAPANPGLRPGLSSAVPSGLDFLTAQEADSVGPIPVARFFHQQAQRVNQASDVCRGNGFFIDENYACVLTPLFCPILKQRWNGSAVVRNQGQLLISGFLQAGRIFLTEEVSFFPVNHGNDNDLSVAAPHRLRDSG
jgi:hypothetical protein